MQRLEIAAGLWVDARRALWLACQRTLVIADVHLGYAWTQRRRGALLPVVDLDESRARLRALQEEYEPETIVFLGDLVHGQPGLDPIQRSLAELLRELAVASRLVLTLGNHDAAVPALATRLGLPLRCVPVWRAGPHRLLHGDASEEAGSDAALDLSDSENGFVVLGHEHPMILLPDGATTVVRCPCFLQSRRALMLPAFSRWAAGVVAGREPFMSAVARQTPWHAAVVILGDRLLRLPWQRCGG